MLETRKDHDWKPCSMGYLRGFCLSTETFREVVEKLEEGEVEINGQWFRMKEKRG